MRSSLRTMFRNEIFMIYLQPLLSKGIHLAKTARNN